jgi:hypothetical protein
VPVSSWNTGTACGVALGGLSAASLPIGWNGPIARVHLLWEISYAIWPPSSATCTPRQLPGGPVHHRGQIYLMLGMLGIETPPLFGLTSEEVRARSATRDNPAQESLP